MTYRVECLTPTLVGDGSRLSPIDYMVWKDQVNVLDQKRIFRLLARGPRLDGYLNQVKRADKLDFASWGGFAQNFAGRRIPFEHPSCSAYWARLRADDCHIPTFAAGPSGPYLPASALRGALRTALVASLADEKALPQADDATRGDRPARNLGPAFEQRLFRSDSSRPGGDPLRPVALSDSRPVTLASMRVFLLRTATLAEPRPPARGFALGWKVAPRGSVDSKRVEDSAAEFAEMAVPGTCFEGSWTQRDFYLHPEIRRALNGNAPVTTETLLAAANRYARVTLEAHRQFAQMTGLRSLETSLAGLLQNLEAAESAGNACLLAMGWGTGLFGKTAYPSLDEAYRRVLAAQPYFARAVRTGLPFPKTRRVVFLGNEPAALPGWVRLEIFP